MSTEHREINSRDDHSLPRPNTIASLITILNRGDRFSLLNDPKVKEGNLDNDIHPIFHHETFLGRTPHIKQALRLASLYLTTPSLLEFYVPLTFGNIQKEEKGAHKRQYNIYTRRKSVCRTYELRVVEAAFMCLAHCNMWQWSDLWDKAGRKRGWGVTHLIEADIIHHTSECPVFDDAQEKPLFKPGKKSRITLDDQMLAFYLDEDTGYVTRPRCEQFRHDFQMALILGHELTHAYCAMIRGTLKEQWLHPSHPVNELGYAWENFMFGGKIDPPLKTMPGSYVHLHKVWQSKDMVRKNLGFEYTAVPVSWTAQWFRKETWDEVERCGHLTNPLPIPTLKISYSIGMQRYIVYTDNEDARRDLDWGRESAALGLTISAGDFVAKLCKDISRAFAMPLDDLAKTSMAPVPRRHFENEHEDTQQYFLKNQRRDFEAWRAMTAARDRLTKPNVHSVGLSYASNITHTRDVMSAPRSKKLSVAGGEIALDDSDSDPKSLGIWLGSGDSAGSELRDGVLLRPKSYNKVHKKYVTSSVQDHVIGKRSREDDRSGEGPPNKRLKLR